MIIVVTRNISLNWRWYFKCLTNTILINVYWKSELPKKKVNYRKRKWITERESTFNVTCSLICPPCLVPSSSLQLGTILANLWIQLLILSRRLLSTVMVGMWELNVRILIQNISLCSICCLYWIPSTTLHAYNAICIYHEAYHDIPSNIWPST